MKVTSMWFWGPVTVIFGGLMALGWSVRPRQVDAGSFAQQNIALRDSLDRLINDARDHPNVSSVTVRFRGPLPLDKEEREYWQKKQTELWSYNRRLGVLIGAYHARKEGKIRFAKVTCPQIDDEKLQSLSGKGALLTTAPQQFGCTYEDPRDIGGKLPDEVRAKEAAETAKR